MPKDARGHGSNPHKIVEVSGSPHGNKSLARVKTRNGQRYDIHGKDTGGKMPKMGSTIHDHPYASPVSIHSGHSALSQPSSNAQAASELARGSQKSETPPTHTAMGGSFGAAARSFADKTAIMRAQTGRTGHSAKYPGGHYVKDV